MSEVYERTWSSGWLAAVRADRRFPASFETQHARGCDV